MANDEDWIEEEMDDYFLGTPEEEDYIDPADYSYRDPATGMTPKQEDYFAYKQALEDYNYNWVGTPWWARTEDPPRWDDYWREPENYQRPSSQYHYHQNSYYSPEIERTKGEKIAIVVSVVLFAITIISLILVSL